MRKRGKSQEHSESVLYLRARQQQLERENARLLRALGQQKEIAHAIAAAVQALEPYDSYGYPRPSRSRHKVVAVMVWSDWHIGEIILPEETEGWGEYNYAIAQDRFYRMLDGFLRWVDVQRSVYPIEELVIMGLGDYISGSIHLELLMTQEFPPVEQAVKAGYMMAEGLRRAAAHARKLRFVGIGADNHGRLFPKPVAKRKYQTNFSYVTHKVAKEMVREIKNISFVESKGMTHLEEINGYRFLATHGDTIRSWMNIPYYGLERRRGLEAAGRMNTHRTFHYMCLGHFHVPSWVGGNILINGSLSGTSEYDHAAGRRSEPAQIAFLVHPEWGFFNLVAFKTTPQK